MVVAAHKRFYYVIANKIIILSLTKQTPIFCRDYRGYTTSLVLLELLIASSAVPPVIAALLSIIQNTYSTTVDG